MNLFIIECLIMYDKTQKGWLLYSIFSVILVFMFFAYLNQSGSNPIPLWPFIFLIVLFLIIIGLFYRLRIVINSGVIRVIYGVGLIKFVFKPEIVNSVEVINTPWWYGLGIRFTPKGMLYNIQGSKAIRINYTEGGIAKNVMLGSPEPERLREFILDHFDRSD